MKCEYQRADEYCVNVTDGTHDSPKKTESGQYLITSKHIKGTEIDYANAYLISQEDFDKINLRSKVDQWDIIISMIGIYCGFCYIERNEKIDYAVKNVGLLKTGSKDKAEWLYYYINSPEGKAYLESVRAGSTQPYISLGELRKFPIPVPDESIRRKICNILRTIDKKIEVNSKINRNLEEQLTALYNEWFGMYKPYNIGIGGDPNYELDTGWKVVDIYSIANIIYGAPFASKLFNTEGDGIPIVRIRDLKNQELVTYTTEKHPKGYLNNLSES